MNPWIRILRPVNGLMGLLATWISALIGVGYALPEHILPISIASISVFLVTSAGNILKVSFVIFAPYRRLVWQNKRSGNH